ncbi:hypothetical protein ASC65_13030 [Brevundimonas sp. Root1279]|nr:hypothetical protein ASC65_13030 [Brevundimonas sp. Root1279]
MTSTDSGTDQASAKQIRIGLQIRRFPESEWVGSRLSHGRRKETSAAHHFGSERRLPALRALIFRSDDPRWTPKSGDSLVGRLGLNLPSGFQAQGFDTVYRDDMFDPTYGEEGETWLIGESAGRPRERT